MVYNYPLKCWSGEVKDFCVTVRLGPCADPVPVADMSQIVCTARNLNTNEIIGARNGQNVLNANGGVYDEDASGIPLFTFTLAASDTTITPANALTTDRETHVFQFTFTTTDGLKGILSLTVECLAQPATALNQAADLGYLRQRFRILIGETNSQVPDDDWIDLTLQDGITATNQGLRYAYDDLEITLEADEPEYDLPDSFKTVLWASYRDKPLQEADQDFLRRRAYWWRSQTPGYPEQYIVWRKKLIVIPTPSAAAVAAEDTLLLRCYTSPPPFRLNGIAQLSDEWWDLPMLWAAVQWFTSPMGRNPAQAAAFKALWDGRMVDAKAEYAKRGIQ